MEDPESLSMYISLNHGHGPAAPQVFPSVQGCGLRTGRQPCPDGCDAGRRPSGTVPPLHGATAEAAGTPNCPQEG